MYGYLYQRFRNIQVLPCLAFIVNYGRVVKLLIERNRSKTLARSEVVGIVQKRITKMAILLTLVVFFCIGFDAIAFINGLWIERCSYMHIFVHHLIIIIYNNIILFVNNFKITCITLHNANLIIFLC